MLISMLKNKPNLQSEHSAVKAMSFQLSAPHSDQGYFLIKGLIIWQGSFVTVDM